MKVLIFFALAAGTLLFKTLKEPLNFFSSYLSNFLIKQYFNKKYLFHILVACALKNPTITGTIPPSVPCPDSLCKHRADGNYNYHYYGVYRSNYFLQCTNGLAYCQPCFPLSLRFSEKCNQCLDSNTGKLLENILFLAISYV